MQKSDGSVKYYGKLSNFMLKNYTIMDNADKMVRVCGYLRDDCRELKALD